MSNISNKRRIMDFLSNGNTLTSAEASSRFNCGNFRATISDIKSQVEQYGNWEITSEETSTGLTRYFMQDTHPDRTYGFDKMGNRVAL